MEKKSENSIKRIALIGPESSGKTTLANQLAEYFIAVWVPEYARDYMAAHKGELTLKDIEYITRQQQILENKMLKKANKFLFVDTEIIINKVWCEDVFKTCPEWISSEYQNSNYDLYLLTDFDLPWQADPVRQNGERREHFFNLYKKHLQNINADFIVISGKSEERFKNSLAAIKKHFGI